MHQKIWYAAPMIDRETIIADAVNGETSKGIARRHGRSALSRRVKT
jgi:hypothetical protein